jgi:tetratricopeptide (TPR) repeat protein
VLVLVWAALAANRLQTFSSHIALWNDAVRRVELVGASPQDVRIYFNRATVHRRERHLFAAIADYNTVLALEPDNRRALRARAQVLVDDQQYDAALRDLDRLLQLEPAQLTTLADRAMVLMQAGRLDEAGHAFDRAVERGVNEPRVYLNRALTRLKSAGIEAAGFALIDIERAIEIDPKYALAHFNRGLLFEEAARAGLKLRDAASPEIMRAIAEQNVMRACQLGHAPACARQAGKKSAEEPAPNTGPIRVTPETLRKQGLPLPK